jgi:hypothetical protein
MTNTNDTGTGNSDVASEMGKVASVITTARRMLADGKMVDITSLEGKVEELCKTAKTLPPEERFQVAQAMAHLIQQLDDLATDLQDQYTAMTHQATTETPARAVAAYQQTNPKK